MTKVHMNVVVQGLRGSLGELVFRRMRDGSTWVSVKPDFSRRKFSQGQLQYKGTWYGGEVFLADRFFPSTKRCSNCGHEQEIDLAERVYRCEMCGLGWSVT